MAMSRASVANSAFFETKSVSQESCTSAATAPVVCTYAAIVPAPSVRSAFFTTASLPFLRKITRAFSMSPPASSSAFLHCMTATPVVSRSALICAEDISIVRDYTSTRLPNAIGISRRQFIKREGHAGAVRVVHKHRLRDTVASTIGAHNSDYRDAHLSRLPQCGRFMARVDNDEHAGQSLHRRNTAKIERELVHFARQQKMLFFRVLVLKLSRFVLRAQSRKIFEPFLNFGKIGQRAADPAVGHRRHRESKRFRGDNILYLVFCAYKEHLLPRRTKLGEVCFCVG